MNEPIGINWTAPLEFTDKEAQETFKRFASVVDCENVERTVYVVQRLNFTFCANMVKHLYAMPVHGVKEGLGLYLQSMDSGELSRLKAGVDELNKILKDHLSTLPQQQQNGTPVDPHFPR